MISVQAIVYIHSLQSHFYCEYCINKMPVAFLLIFQFKTFDKHFLILIGLKYRLKKQHYLSIVRIISISYICLYNVVNASVSFSLVKNIHQTMWKYDAQLHICNLQITMLYAILFLTQPFKYSVWVVSTICLLYNIDHCQPSHSLCKITQLNAGVFDSTRSEDN